MAIGCQLDSTKGREIEGCEVQIQTTSSGEVHGVIEQELLYA